MGIRSINHLVVWGILFGILCACAQNAEENELPYLGKRSVHSIIRNGERVEYTVYERIPAFSFMDQDSLPVSEKTLHGRIYVADFIFLSCPTICPKMTTEMKRVYDRFESRNELAFVSFTIDPENDSIPRLKQYAKSLHARSGKWYFLTGDQTKIMDLAENGYYAIAKKDKASPGGYAHSGGLLLVDGQGHIRGVYDGTNKKETERLMQDIDKLLP